MEYSDLETNDVKIWIENEILMVEFKPHITHITLNFSKQYVQDRFKVMNEKTRPILVDICKANSVDKEARYYLSGDEASKYISSGAILVKNSVAKLISSLFHRINKPPFPTRVFTIKERDKAIKWLSMFKDVN